MSRTGRWRLTWRGLKLAGAAVVAGWVGWGAVMVAGALQRNPDTLPSVAKSVPVRTPELKTDGVLTVAWLERTLSLRKNVSLLELDLGKLRQRLLAEPQVLTAALTCQFPDRLLVRITERTPVARVMAQRGEEQVPLLVARDGALFAGEGHAPENIAALPWLDGIKLVPRGEGFAPLAGMPVVADLLSRAQFEAPHLYETWRVVSLARLEADREIEVRAAGGFTVVFNAGQDFFRQLAKLDLIWEKVAHAPAVQTAHINLSLGREVPVMIELVARPAAQARPAAAKTAPASPARPFVFSFSSQNKREL